MRGNRTSGSLNWMDGGATTTIDCLWAPLFDCDTEIACEFRAKEY